MNNTIAQKNDWIRSRLIGCKVVLTAKVANSEIRENILIAVRGFNEFTFENDPYGEHDCAFFMVAQQAYYFKFDYYDDDYEFYEEDGLRVLTIGHVSDY